MAKFSAQLGLDTRPFDQRLKAAFSSFNSFGKGLMSLGNLIRGSLIGGGVLAAFTVIQNGFKSTEAGADKLNEITGLLQGSMQGLFGTLNSGDWGTLITNITNAARATRDLKVATDELDDIIAGSGIKKGILSSKLQDTRLAIAGTTDPTQRAALIQQAKDYQTQISQIDLDNKKRAIANQWQYYKTLLSQGDKFAKMFQERAPQVAADWSYWGTEAAYTTLIDQITDLEYRLSTGGGTDFDRQQLSQARAIKAIIDQINVARNELGKEGEFNKLLGDLADLHMLQADASESLVRLERQLTQSENKMIDSNERTILSFEELWGTLVKPDQMALGKVALPLQMFTTTGRAQGQSQYVTSSIFADPSKLAEVSKNISTVTQDMGGLLVISDQIAATFGDMFSAGIMGWDEFGKAAVAAIQQMLVQLAALAATYALLSLIPGFTEFIGFTDFMRRGMGLGSKTSSLSDMTAFGSGPITLNVEGRLSGSDIMLSNARAGNRFNNHT